MQTQQQKQLQNLIDSSLSDEKQNMQSHAEMIVKVLSCRVDMPKHFITLLSKNLSTKDETRIEKVFDQLWFVTHKYQNKIALFNQISANKQFLLKISSLLAMKNISQTIKTKIIDLVYEWKEQFKPNKQLFPNFWNFFSNFQKKGYFPSNSNFQTKYQQAQLIQNPSSETETLKNESAKDIFDLMQQQSENLDFSKIEKAALNLFYSAVNRIVMQNAIISNTSPQILDFPPVLKQKMAELKILQDKINRFVGQNKSQTTIDIALKLIKAVHMTQKRYTELITRYLPSKFVLPQNLLKFQQYCQTNVQFLKQTNDVQKKQIYLLDLDNSGTKNNKKDDLLNFDISFHIKGHGQVEPAKSNISSFFGNLINNVNTPNQVTLSNQPNQNEFKTDYDFKGYQDPKSISQYLFN